MNDVDMFAVCCPESGEIGYCSVLGKAVGEIGFHVYPGEDGLRSCIKLLEAPEDFDGFQMYLSMNTISLFYDDLEECPSSYRKFMKSIPVKFENHIVPFFVRYFPKYASWSLSSEEARFMTVCLEQALEVDKLVQEAGSKILLEKEDAFLIRYSIEDNKTQIWKTGYVIGPEPKPVLPQWILPSDERIKEVKKRVKLNRNAAWELDVIYLDYVEAPANERPYFPVVVLLVDAKGKIIEACLVHPDDVKILFLEILLSAMEKEKIRPGKILIRNDELMLALVQVYKGLGIKLGIEDELNQVPRAMRMLKERIAEREEDGDLILH